MGVRAPRVSRSPTASLPGLALLFRGATGSIGTCAVILSAPVAPAAATTIGTGVASGCIEDLYCERQSTTGFEFEYTTISAGIGEANRVSVTREGDSWLIREAGAPLAAHPRCTAVDATAVRCPVTPTDGRIVGLRVSLGDRDDVLSVAAGIPVTIDAGSGADRITGGPDREEIEGGPGPDRIDGGGGGDSLDFSARYAPVTVDVAAGRTGEGDAFVNVARIIGGHAGDRMDGSERGDVLIGGPGPDVLRGRGGEDLLNGEAGHDRLYGGAGDDGLQGDHPLDRGDDLMDGGAGDDELYAQDRGGRDRSLGGPGRDQIVGGTGVDEAFGGAGADRIFTRGDRSRDRVDCGAGRDRVSADPRDLLQRC